MIAAFIDYLDKLARVQPHTHAPTLGNNWKDFGRKRNVLRF